jgi:hypothetical protein
MSIWLRIFYWFQHWAYRLLVCARGKHDHRLGAPDKNWRPGGCLHCGKSYEPTI